MKVTIDLINGEKSKHVSKVDLNKNIEALERAIEGKPQCSDFVSLRDTLTILEAIKKQLPD